MLIIKNTLYQTDVSVYSINLCNSFLCLSFMWAHQSSRCYQVLLFQERIITEAPPAQALCGVRQRRLWSRWAQSQSAFFEKRFLTGKVMLVSLTALRFTVIKSCLEAFSVAERQSDGFFMHVHMIPMEPGCNRHK